MLKNDERHWQADSAGGAASLLWSGSGGDAAALLAHERKRWASIRAALTAARIPLPAGRILEFGAGMGGLDDILGDETSAIVMLDHSDRFLAARPRALSPRSRFLPWRPAVFDELRREEPFDWLVALAVFYHVDTATAAALLLELGASLAPGGHALISGWRGSDRDTLRALATRERLFATYPAYALDVAALSAALDPEFHELCREPVLVYRRAS